MGLVWLKFAVAPLNMLISSLSINQFEPVQKNKRRLELTVLICILKLIYSRNNPETTVVYLRRDCNNLGAKNDAIPKKFHEYQGHCHNLVATKREH